VERAGPAGTQPMHKQFMRNQKAMKQAKGMIYATAAVTGTSGNQGIMQRGSANDSPA